MIDFCERCKHKGDHDGKCLGCIGRVNEHGVEDMLPTHFESIEGQHPSGMTNLERHALICSELNELYKRKNTDYGDSFHKTFLEEGMAMPRIRLSDKLERFKRLTRSGEQNVKDETIRDTLIDLANYAIMTAMELDGGGDPHE